MQLQSCLNLAATGVILRNLPNPIIACATNQASSTNCMCAKIQKHQLLQVKRVAHPLTDSGTRKALIRKEPISADLVLVKKSTTCSATGIGSNSTHAIATRIPKYKNV
jgi:hypothetical protein